MKNTRKLRAKEKMVLRGVLAVLVLMCLELISYAGGRLLQKKWGMWKSPVIGKERSVVSYSDYLDKRDPVVGWPYRVQYGKDLDITGAQRNPYFPDRNQGEACVAMYGDSLTEGGDTTSIQHNWGNVLSKLLNCYVANFGMGGYGTDQAYLRYKENEEYPSQVAIFGLHPGDMLRNLTRIRDLQSYNQRYSLKPRFILDQNKKLKLIPIPDLTEDEYLRATFIKEPPLILEHENLQPGGPAGVVKLEFPYTLSVINNGLTFYGLHSRLRKEPVYTAFFQEGHPLQGLEITSGITDAFVSLARERGQVPVVIILPLDYDILYYRSQGVWPHQPLIERYKANKIPYIDFGTYLILTADQRQRETASFFGETGHYNDDACALVAEFVYEYLTKNELIKHK